MSDPKADAKAIFLEALECKGADELRSFLDQACGADAGLRARVEELLRAHQDAGAFLGGGENQEATRDQAIAEGPGTIIGPYKLLEQIGEGGFGSSSWPNSSSRCAARSPSRSSSRAWTPARSSPASRPSGRRWRSWTIPISPRSSTAAPPLTGRPYFVMELVQGRADHRVLRPEPLDATASGWNSSSPSARPSSTRIRRASSIAT